MIVVETELTKRFIEAIDPVWPQGIPYVAQAIECGFTEHTQAWMDAAHDPLWAWGVVPMWEGVGAVWLLFDRRANRYVFRIVREARKYMAQVEASGYRRLQGEFACEAPTRRLADFFGFQTEGILRNYGLNGEGDYVMVSRIN